jgi:hypothetical protein
MLLVIVPVIYLTALAHYYLRLYAPSNVLVTHIRATAPRWRIVAALLGVSVALIALAHGLEVAVADGAPRWWNLIAIVAAWDGLKLGLLAIATLGRCSYIAVRTAFRPPSADDGRTLRCPRVQ